MAKSPRVRRQRSKKPTDRFLLEWLVLAIWHLRQDVECLTKKVEDNKLMVIDDLEASVGRIEDVTAKLQELAKEPNPSDARVVGVTNRLNVVADAAQAVIDSLSTTPDPVPVPEESPV